MRIILFSGKGGSGVTTIAAATASELAAAGERVLAFGINRGLGAAFGAAVGLEPSVVAERLEAVEGHGGHSGPDEFRDWLEALLDWRKMDPELAEDLSSLPGINHMGRLLELERLVSSDTYDVVIVDAADLSQFLDLPAALDAAARWLERLFAPRQQTVFEPIFRAFAQDYASVGDDVFQTGKALLTRLAGLREIMTDPEITSARIVVAPATSTLGAVHEAVSVLSLFGYRVDAIVANRLIPDDVTDPFFGPAKMAQARLLAELEATEGLPEVLWCNLRPEAVHGVTGHAELAVTLYGGADPGDLLSDLQEHAIEAGSDHYILRVLIPYAKREDLRLEEVDEGIAVQLNGRRCVITLPADVVYSVASAWSYEDRVLRVTLDR